MCVDSGLSLYVEWLQCVIFTFVLGYEGTDGYDRADSLAGRAIMVDRDCNNFE